MTPSLIKTAFNKTGVSPFNSLRVMTNPDIQWQEDESPAHNLRSQGDPPCTTLEAAIQQCEKNSLDWGPDREKDLRYQNKLIQEDIASQAKIAIIESHLQAYKTVPPASSRDTKSLGTGKYMTLRDRDARQSKQDCKRRKATKARAPTQE
ncbi:hypothetical protein EX30DRAFT_349296 [Ascodesmis nigricans]|uniref:Uncharacterized protein n=1 Tax=Ascodesmis nigricans TaxID=341454 RepID=A0A4S2MVW8_9PEZI|nr:hypothetical protein EX30DRAFT_349296 [Ascodesmis nigricans]